MRRIAVGILAVVVAGCASGHNPSVNLSPGHVRLEEVARCDHQWTGVTVAPDGRIFVNFPRWKDWPGTSVAELKKDVSGNLVPFAYPNAGWQQWTTGQTASAADHFLCVQSVVADKTGHLWVVDAAAPDMGEIVPGGPKLVEINLATNAVERTYTYAAPVIGAKSYLNDVRVDDARHIAYMTDSGMGGIIVTDLKTGQSWKALADSPTVKSEGVDVVVNGKPWRRDGQKPDVHSDGIALSTDGNFLYYHALTGRTLYRVPTENLRAANNAHVVDLSKGQSYMVKLSGPERLGETGITDGMWYAGGNAVYLADPEKHAITRFDPNTGLQVIVQSQELQWPDTFSAGADGSLYVTTSQIDTQPHPPGPYRLFRILPQK